MRTAHPTRQSERKREIGLWVAAASQPIVRRFFTYLRCAGFSSVFSAEVRHFILETVLP
jgi:hypothetical protein